MSNEIMSRKDLSNQLVKGGGGVLGGAGLMIIASFGAVPTLIAGGALTLIGLGLSKSRKDRTAGLVTVGAGALALISAIPGLNVVSKFVLGVGGFGLLGVGVFTLIKFFKNLKKRS